MLGIVALVVSFVSACTPGAKEVPPDTLLVQLANEPVSLDPSLVEDGLGFRILVNIMDGLMGYTNEGELVKRLAESYEISPDKKTYRFKLRADATWSDGVAVTASQIRFAIERALKPSTGSKLSGLFRALDRIEVQDPLEITFVLKRPVSYFLQALTLPLTYPLREDVLQANGGKWDPLRGSKVPTNGAYSIANYERDQKIELVARATLAPQAPQKVLLRIIQDESTGASLFQRGSLDVLSRIPAYDQKKYEEKKQVRTVPFLATYFVGFNLKKPPFNDREFRRALAGSIKKAELVRALGTGEFPASSWIPKGLEGSTAYVETEEGFDPRFADSVKRVREKKYAGKISMAFDSSGRNSMVMEKIQADAKANLGWKAELSANDWKTYVKAVYSDPSQVFRFGWSTPMADPVIFLSAFMTKDPFTFTNYSNPAYDALVAKIQEMEPSPERTKLIIDAQAILVEKEAIIIPIYHYVSTQVVGPRLEKYGVSPFGHTRYEEVRFKR